MQTSARRYKTIAQKYVAITARQEIMWKQNKKNNLFPTPRPWSADPCCHMTVTSFLFLRTGSVYFFNADVLKSLSWGLFKEPR